MSTQSKVCLSAPARGLSPVGRSGMCAWIVRMGGWGFVCAIFFPVGIAVAGEIAGGHAKNLPGVMVPRNEGSTAAVDYNVGSLVVLENGAGTNMAAPSMGNVLAQAEELPISVGTSDVYGTAMAGAPLRGNVFVPQEPPISVGTMAAPSE